MPKSVSLILPSLGQHQIRRLQVAVHDAVFVGILQRIARLDGKVDDFAPGHAAAIENDLLERLALDELHGDVRGAAKPAHGKESDDVGVPELLEDLGFALEAVADLAPLGIFGTHDLDGGDTAGLLVGPPVDDTHGARAHDRFDPERAELFADQPLSLAHDREHPDCNSVRPSPASRHSGGKASRRRHRFRPRCKLPSSARPRRHDRHIDTTRRRPPADSHSARSP